MEAAEMPFDEILHASAVQFLLDGHEEDVANVLLSCTLQINGTTDSWYRGSEKTFGMQVLVFGSRAAYSILTDSNSSTMQAVRNAIGAVLPPSLYISEIVVRARLVDIDATWNKELLEIARGKVVHNQGINAIKLWKNLRFRSFSEIRIAEALDKVDVLFFPNCLARLTTEEGRENKEPDFLICHKGKWGILEVDGEPFHPSSRTVEDHKRDRLFRNHGIHTIEHFDARECLNNPDKVVRDFLKFLE